MSDTEETPRDPARPAPRRNAFQNLDEGSALWAAAFERSYSDHLAAGELATLKRCFQQRHLLAHQEGLVDAAYVTKSGDTSYRVGQRLVIRDQTVREAVNLVEKLGAGLRTDAT